MNHIDLFSGIGGFALAAKRTWGEDYNNLFFCDNDAFCQAVLRKNFKDCKIYDNIKTLSRERFIADSDSIGLQESRSEQQTDRDGQFSKTSSDSKSGKSREQTKWQGRENTGGRNIKIDLLTGGFPCQPFSQAGQRKGTEDDRHLWPEMLRVIGEFKPTYVIGENVGGLLTWNGGMVLDQVFADLENQNYEVRAFVIPACAVNAPHRRDRVWIVAHAKDERSRGCASEECGMQERKLVEDKCQGGEIRSESQGRVGKFTDSTGSGLQRCNRTQINRCSKGFGEFNDWGRNWIEVASELCAVDDGLSGRLVRLPDGTKISGAKWRNSALKAAGNAIVPQVAEKIMQAIKICQ